MGVQENRTYTKELEITPHTQWSQAFWDQLLPIKDRISQHPFFVGFASGQLSLACVRYALLNFQRRQYLLKIKQNVQEISIKT